MKPKELGKGHAEWLGKCRYFLGDKGYNKGTDILMYGSRPQRHDSRIFRIKCGEDRMSYRETVWCELKPFFDLPLVG